jgi:tetratricopeptide (TPR) repeat protein
MLSARAWRPGWIFSLALGLVLWSAAAWADATLDRAKRLLQEKNPKAAFELLAPLQAQRAGEIEFDYLLGIAALDAGDAQQAVFALERVLAVNPNYLQARAEIARAYFALGERDNARREFEAVKARGGEIPPEARESIDRFLSALAPQQTEFKAYIELALGYDSNTNSATSRSTIAIPFFGGAIAQLDPAGVSKGAWFGGVLAGGSVSHPVSDQVALIGSAGYGGKFNQRSANDFDTQQFDLSGGARWAAGANSVVGLVQAQRFWVDNDTYRNSFGGTVQWLHNLSPAQQFTLFGQYAALRFPDQSPNDADRWIFGAGYSQALALDYAPVYYVSAYGGEQKETDSSFPWLGFKPYGLRVGGQISLNERTLLFASFSYEYRRYNGVEPLFLVRRQDDQYDARIGLTYVFAPKWSVTPQVAYTNNQSNIQLNEYDRTIASVAVRRDF